MENIQEDQSHQDNWPINDSEFDILENFRGGLYGYFRAPLTYQGTSDERFRRISKLWRDNYLLVGYKHGVIPDDGENAATFRGHEYADQAIRWIWNGEDEVTEKDRHFDSNYGFRPDGEILCILDFAEESGNYLCDLLFFLDHPLNIKLAYYWHVLRMRIYYLCSYGHEMIFIGGEYTERVSSLLVDLYSIQTSMNELDQRSLGEKNVQTSEFCKPIIQDIRNLIIKIRPRFTELVIKAGTKRKPIPVGKIEKSPEHYSIIKGPQFWTLRYGGKDSMIQADLKGLKLLEILLRNKNRDYYPSELLRDAFPPQEGTIRTLSDGESMDEQLSNGDGISSDDAKKIRDRDKKSVERALSKVFGKIDHQELRNHFEGCIQTGTIVCYKPGQSFDWIIA